MDKEKLQALLEEVRDGRTSITDALQALKKLPYEDLDEWDDRTLREWMLQHTRNEGVIELWEFITVVEAITENWWDHSASDNLYVRKMHYEEARMAGYSFWPKQGWDRLFDDLRDAVVEHGGQVHMGTPVETVLIEDGILVLRVDLRAPEARGEGSGSS